MLEILTRRTIPAEKSSAHFKSIGIEKAPDEEREINALLKNERPTPGIKIDTAAVRERLAEEVRWMNQLVKPLHRRLWSIHIDQVRQMEDETLQLRVKFMPHPMPKPSFPMTWIVGDQPTNPMGRNSTWPP